jgi:glycosyltransferase involved in cell wall biosynthesis
MNLRKYIPSWVKYPLIAAYTIGRLLTRGVSGNEIVLTLSGVLPTQGSRKIIHGGKVKLLHLRERFGDSWKRFNIAYFVSSGLPFAPAIWLRLYKLFGIKTVWNQNGLAYPAWANEKAQAINNLLKPIHLSDYVVYQTEFTRRCTERFLGFYTGPYSVLINPVDTKKFKPGEISLPTEPFVIIMSGHHFESPERLQVSLDAVREVRKRGIEAKLLVIGNTQEVPQEDWLEVIGKFTQEEAPGLYQRAHILLHLKNLDPCPTIVLEALSSGLPVVGLANGGMPELVDENSGVLIPAIEDFEKFIYPSPSEVASAILEVKDGLKAFSAGARELALKFDKEIWLERHEEIFKSLLK